MVQSSSANWGRISGNGNWANFQFLISNLKTQNPSAKPLRFARLQGKRNSVRKTKKQDFIPKDFAGWEKYQRRVFCENCVLIYIWKACADPPERVRAGDRGAARIMDGAAKLHKA